MKREFAEKLEKAMAELWAVGLAPSPPAIYMNSTPISTVGHASPIAYVTIFGIAFSSAIPERWLELED